MIKQLVLLKDDVIQNKGLVGGKKLFQGASLVISDKYQVDTNRDYILVTTKYAFELSTLIYRLKEIFKEKIDFFNKYSFYGRLGEAANNYLKNNPDNFSILFAVLEEGFTLVEDIEDIRYFAYGSNMDEKQMTARCPEAKPVGIGRLDNFKFKLDFKGVATVQKSRDDKVWGVIWKINSRDIESLDIHEGIAKGYYSRSFLSITEGPQQHESLIYTSLRSENEGIRREGYLEKIVAASKKWNFSQSYIDYLMSF